MTLTKLFAAAVTLVLWQPAQLHLQAALIAEWQFNSYGGGPLSNLAPDYGTQLSATATTDIPFHASFNRIAGTPLNEHASSSPNYALRMEHGTGQDLTYTLTLHVHGTGLSGFTVTLASRQSGSVAQTWAWSTDGATFTAIAPSITPSATWSVATADFRGVTVLNNPDHQDVYFRTTFDLTRNNATVDFDNIAVNAVPEPVGIALACFGVAFFGLGLVRRF